jgi:hypothetical protein
MLSKHVPFLVLWITQGRSLVLLQSFPRRLLLFSLLLRPFVRVLWEPSLFYWKGCHMSLCDVCDVLDVLVAAFPTTTLLLCPSLYTAHYEII